MSGRVGGSVPKGATARKVAELQAKRGIDPAEAKKQAQVRQQQQQTRRSAQNGQNMEQTRTVEPEEDYNLDLFPPKKPADLILRVDNPTHTCPFFQYAMAGETRLLEDMIKKKMYLDESKCLYLGTAIVNIPGVDLFPPLRLVDTNSGSTLLHFAALSNIETVQLLVNYGMINFINARNRTGATPVFLAAGRGHLDIVRYLVERGATVTNHTNEGASLLHSAVMSGNYDLVHYLLSLPQIEVNVDDDEFMTPLGLAITRVSELRKQLDEMQVLMDESVKTMMIDSAKFIMDENERVDALRQSRGIAHSDESQTDPELNFMTVKDQQIIMMDILESDQTLQHLKMGLQEGEKLLANFIKMTKLLLDPPIFQLTVPEMIHEHRPKNIESVAKLQRKMDEQAEAGRMAKLGLAPKITPISATSTTTVQTESGKTEDQAETGENKQEDDELPPLESTEDDGLEVFQKNGKFYTRRPAQQIIHTPDRAKVVHFAPYISYWMLLVETQELDLIETCLESSEIDVNWTFPMGDKVKNATALHYAVDLGNTKLAKLLIDHGANPGAEIDIAVSLATHADAMPVPQRDGSTVADDQTAVTPNQEGQNNIKITKDGNLFPRQSISVDAAAPQIIDLGHQLLSSLCDNVTKSTIEFVKDSAPKAFRTAAAPRAFRGFISKQQGFTPLLAALYNKNEEMAKFLIDYCQSRCLGPTYLATHTLTPYPNLLTPDLLELLPPEDIERKLEEQRLEVAKKLESMEQNDPNSTHRAPQITSFMDLLRTLSPFMTVSSNQVMEQRRKAEAMKKMEAAQKKAEEDRKFQDANLGQAGHESDKPLETSLDSIDTTDEEDDNDEDNEEVDLSPLDSVTSFIPDPLRVAITNGYDQVVHALLTLGVDINTPYFQSNITLTKNRPLQSLTGEQYQYNVSIELTDMGFTPLFNAIKSKNTAVVRQLLSIGSHLDLSLYTYLLSLGIDINKTHYLPLYNEDSDREIVEMADNGQDLIKITQLGAKASESKKTKTPTQPQSPIPSQQLIRIDFYSPTASLPTTIQAVQYHPDVLHMLVAHKNDILAQTTNDLRTALHYSCDLNKPVLSTYLLSNNPLAMYCREQAGMTPLSLAVANDHAEVCKILLTFLRRTRSPLVVFHPHRPALVLGDETDLDDDVDRVQEYYGEIDRKFEFYPKPLSKPDSMDDIDSDSGNHDDDMKTSEDDEVLAKKDIIQDKVRPYWVDLIVEQDDAPFVFSPIGFDRSSFEAYHKYVTRQYYPAPEDGKTPEPELTFSTYHQSYPAEEYNPIRQQLQSQPLRWLGFDISCANIMSFYYAIVNNPRDLENEHLINSMQPFIESIDGLYGHVIRAFRLAAVGGAFFSLKQLAAAMVAYPQIKATDSELPTPVQIIKNKATPVPTKPHSLWIELIVPTEEQLKTRIATAGGYQLLANNIVVDQHGFITRNVTYQYACEFYRTTIARGMISSTRVCLPLVTYLATEILSTVSKQGNTFLLGEALGFQALPLLHGLRGTTFIRCFHQFYTCNPLFFDRKTMTFNYNGVIRNRTQSLPFTEFMQNDTGRIDIPISTGSRHFIVSKSLITERLKHEVVKRYLNDSKKKGVDVNDDDYPPPLIDMIPPTQTLTSINVYKVPTFSPLHLAVINDHVGLIRLLIGLAPFPDQEKEEDDEEQNEFTNDQLTTLDTEKGEEEKDHEGEEPKEAESNLTSVDDDVDNAESVSVSHVLDDILLQPRQTQTLTHLVSKLNLLPDTPGSILSQYGPDLTQQDDDEDDEAEMDHHHHDGNDAAPHGDQTVQTRQLTEEEQNYDPQNDPLFAGIDLQALLSQAIEDTKKEEENSDKAKKLSNRLAKLPPLLHVPQPTDPIFQLINRLAVRPMQIEVETKTDDGKTISELKSVDTIVHPLHLCAIHDLVDSAELLIQYGAIIDIQDHDGNTPLHLAIRDGSRLILDIFLSYSANINSQNNEGNTPIHVAILTGQVDLAKVLLEEYQPDLTLKNKDGKTAPELMAESEDKYRAFVEQENNTEDDFLAIEALFTPSTQKVDQPDLKTMSPEEKRKHNLDQIKKIREQLSLMKE